MVEARGGFGAPGAHRADVRATPQAGCGRAWRGHPEIHAGKAGSVPTEGSRHRPQLQALWARPGHPGSGCCRSVVFLSGSLLPVPYAVHYVGEGRPETQPSRGWDRWSPRAEGAQGSGVGLGKEGTAKINLQASSVPGPKRASAPCPFPHPTLEHPPGERGLPGGERGPQRAPLHVAGSGGPKVPGP